MHGLGLILFIKVCLFDQGLTSLATARVILSDEAETLIPQLSAALFEEYKGILYMHGPIDRAALTQPLINQSWALVGMESGKAAAGR
jgi:hypothetical protein